MTKPLAETKPAAVRDNPALPAVAAHATGTSAAGSGAAGSAPSAGGWRHVSAALQVVLALAVALGVLAYLLFAGNHGPSPEDEKRPTKPEAAVEIVPPGLKIRAGAPFASKITEGVVHLAEVKAPALPVTGAALAKLRPGKERGKEGAKEGSKDTWQFATPELLQAFADWEKAVTDIGFQEGQRKLVAELNKERVEAQERVVARTKKLFEAEVVSEKDLALEQTALTQYKVQERKENHEAEIAVKIARQAEATLARQLQQAGLDPSMLRSAAAEGDIIVAEVPESMVSRVKLGMVCDVTFFAIPDYVFTGKVSSMAPVISKDKRVLNVQFTVKEKHGSKEAQELIRPGMFAQVGVGAGGRKALLAPAEGILHVGDKDYALAKGSAGTWVPVEIRVGDPHGDQIEILDGLKDGAAVLGRGAILLKPVLVRLLEIQAAASVAPKDAGAKDAGAKGAGGGGER